MKFLPQILYILLFSLLGELLEAIIPLPIPAAIYGLVLLLIALCAGLLKEEHIAATADLLVSFLPLLFVSPAIQILEYWGLIAPNLAAIFTVIAVSTFLVFAVSGLVVKWIQRKKEDERNA